MSKTHGMRSHPIYSVWVDMKRRCQNPKHQKYVDYGGRGIKVCERWQDAANFIQDMLPTWKPGLTLDRRDNDGNYDPSNCRWATQQEQNVNRRPFGAIPFNGVSKEGNRYRVRIRINDKRISVGSFSTPEEAAEAYNLAALKYRGEGNNDRSYSI